MATTQGRENRYFAKTSFISECGRQYKKTFRSLPAKGASDDPKFLLAQFGPEILSRVNYYRGRVRPSFSLDTAAGTELYHREQRSVAAEIQANDLTDRLNVINFSSLFSGTAIAPQRSISALLKFTF